MQIKGRDTETVSAVQFDGGYLRIVFVNDDDSATLLTLPSYDPEYLAAMIWAINNNHLGA